MYAGRHSAVVRRLESPPAFRFLDPALVIAVAVEDDPPVFCEGLANQLLQVGVKIRGLLQLIGKPLPAPLP